MDKIPLSKKRYNKCLTCNNFNQTTKQCKLCNCFMFVKTRFINAKCPIGTW